MQFLIAAFAGLLAAGLTTASPVPEAAPEAIAEALTLPDGWEPIASEEVYKRMTDPHYNIEKRQVGGIYLCTKANWSGQCGYKVQPVCYSGDCNTRSGIDNHCVVLGSPWYHGIGSFGPDGGQTVFLSVNGNCHEASGRITNPGSGDFYNYKLDDGEGAGGAITSFLIFAN